MGEISKKVHESRLKWYGHVLRREDEYVGRIVMGTEAPGKRKRGTPKRRWLDNIKNDLSEREFSVEDPQDRHKWRRLIRPSTPHKSCNGCGTRRWVGRTKLMSNCHECMPL